MRAIYNQGPVYCVVVEDDGDGVLLEPMDGGEDERFWVSYDNPHLVLDPTDDQVEDCENS